MAERRGQLFTADFVASAAVFVAVVVSLSAIWVHLQADAASRSERDALSTRAFSLSESLVRSPGTPADWNASSVQAAGFAGEETLVLDTEKLLSFLDLNYSRQKEALALGGFEFGLRLAWNGSADYSGVIRPPVAYYSYGEDNLFEPLDGSNYTWDYYWGGQGVFPEPSHGSARFFTAGSKIAALNALLANQSYYSTIIVEAPNFSSAELSSVDLALLKLFAETGGIIFYVGDGSAEEMLVGENFSASFDYSPLPRQANVTQRSHFLRNATVGEGVFMVHSNWAAFSNASLGDAPVDSWVSDADGRALVARWRVGWGFVYYIADWGASFERAGNGAAVFNAIGWLLEYGMEPAADAQNVFVVNRLCAIETGKRRLDALALTVWEP